MASRYNTLLLGELRDVETHVTASMDLTDEEIQAVLINLIRRVARLERATDREADYQQEQREQQD